MLEHCVGKCLQVKTIWGQNKKNQRQMKDFGIMRIKEQKEKERARGCATSTFEDH